MEHINNIKSKVGKNYKAIAVLNWINLILYLGLIIAFFITNKGGKVVSLALAIATIAIELFIAVSPFLIKKILIPLDITLQTLALAGGLAFFAVSMSAMHQSAIPPTFIGVSMGETVVFFVIIIILRIIYATRVQFFQFKTMSFAFANQIIANPQSTATPKVVPANQPRDVRQVKVKATPTNDITSTMNTQPINQETMNIQVNKKPWILAGVFLLIGIIIAGVLPAVIHVAILQIIFILFGIGVCIAAISRFIFLFHALRHFHCKQCNAFMSGAIGDYMVESYRRIPLTKIISYKVRFAVQCPKCQHVHHYSTRIRCKYNKNVEAAISDYAHFIYGEIEVKEDKKSKR